MIAFQAQFAPLEARRRALGITKILVAKHTGVSLPTVNRILTGREANPTVESIGAIAKLLGVTVQLGAQEGLNEAQNAHEFRKARALVKAKRLVRQVQGNMALEGQGLDAKTLEQMIERTSYELLTGPAKQLWED